MKIARMGDAPEIFYSLQGEGVSLGRPAVFLRLALCNLACSWCDTPYTWKGEDGLPVVEMSPAEVAAALERFPYRHVVITGGEPLLQSRELCELVKLLPEHSFEVETNGTLVPPEELDRRVSQYNVSPKLAHSGNKPERALRKEALAWFAASPKAWFKFVVSAPADMEEVLFRKQEYGLPNERILLMPCGTTAAEIEKVLPWLAGECLKQGCRLTDRLHIRLWGNKPGV